MTGTLISDTGEQITVTGHLVETSATPQMFSLNPNSTSATYEYTLYSGSSNELSANELDSTMSARIYITLHYNGKNTPTEYLLTKVSGKWTILDLTVGVTEAELVYGCTGFSSDGIFTTQTDSKYVSNNFSVNTGFTHYATDGAMGVLGANLTLTFKMGSTRTWKFTMYNNLFSEGV